MKKFTAHDIIVDYMLLSENYNQQGYLLLDKVLELEWYDLFKKTKESVARKWVPVEKGIVKFPKSLERLLGLYIVDNCGDLAPLFEDNVKNIIDIPKLKCPCQSCQDDCLCGTIQDSLVQVDVIMEGVTYKNKEYTRLLPNGKIVKEVTEWVPSYNTSGVFTGVEQVSSQSTVCEIDVRACGCPIESQQNISKLFGCGCIMDCYLPSMREHYPALYNDFGYYKVDDENKQVFIFDRKGKRSKLIQVEMVYESNGADMEVPQYARKAIMACIDEGRKAYSPNFNQNERDAATRKRKREVFEMIVFLNPINYELFVRTSDARRKNNNMRYIHPNLIGYGEDCNNKTTKSLPTTTNVTNINYGSGGGTGAGKPSLKLIVGGGGDDDPVAGSNSYQNPKIANLGTTNGGRISIKIAAQDMVNYGIQSSFSYSPTSAQIVFSNGYTLQEGDSVEIPLNQ